LVRKTPKKKELLGMQANQNQNKKKGEVVKETFTKTNSKRVN